MIFISRSIIPTFCPHFGHFAINTAWLTLPGPQRTNWPAFALGPMSITLPFPHTGHRAAIESLCFMTFPPLINQKITLCKQFC